MGILQSIRELLCRVFGHIPCYIRGDVTKHREGTYREYKSYTVVLGCVRCGEHLEMDDYSKGEIRNNVEKYN